MTILHKIFGRTFVVVALVATSGFLYFFSQNQAAVSAAQSITTLQPAEQKMTPITAPALTTVQFFGDIMLERNVARAMGKSGLSYIFQNVTGTKLFGDADLTVANLEGPFAPKRLATSKSIAFRFDPTFATSLKSFGFSGFNLANNHSYDMGAKNVTFTRKTLQNAGLSYFGDELKEGPMYTWFTTGTPRLAFIGIHNTYHTPDLAKVTAAIRDAKSKADLVFLNVHWGEEYKDHSNKKQQIFAHQLIDLGADAIIGHHPHVVEEMELYKNKPIFYSLGNFIFDQYFSTPTQEGLSVVLSFSSSSVKSIELRPFYSKKSAVYTMEGARKENFLQWFTTNSRLGDKQFVDSTLQL